jgi:glutathione synthase/RimK-type ligase-like ATP-grasp enzyme
MLKRCLVIGGLSYDTKPQTPYAEGLAELIPEAEFKEVRFDHLVFYIAPGIFSIKDARTGEELSEYDLVFFRGRVRRSSQLAYVVSRYCEINGLPFLNDYSGYRPTSKLSQAVTFYEQQVPFLDTYFSLNREYLQAALEPAVSYPFILKDNYGAHGNHNYLVKDQAQLDAILTENADMEFIAQPFCANDGDYRVLVVGGREPLQIWRQAGEGSHLNNTSQGGQASLVNELPAETIAQAQAVAASLKMSLAGVDILKNSDDGLLYFLEINSQPQILTGAFVPEKMAEIRQLLNGYLNK